MIELRDIQRVFGSKVALNEVSLSIEEGESVAIVGESGSGKSTLARILLRLIAPSFGSYSFDGVDVLALRGAALRQWRRNTQAVFQNPQQSLNPRLRVMRLVTEPLEVAGEVTHRRLEAKAGELLELVGLPANALHRYPHQLSGGQRQRVAIARAISIRPKLLVLDEPVSALDVSVRAQILNLMRDLIEDFGITVAYITHDLATVSYLCNRAYVLYQGVVFEQLSSAQLVSDPSNPYTRTLLDSVPSLDANAQLVAPALSMRSSSVGCHFAARCPRAEPRCFEEKPPLVDVAPGWLSRCHFAVEDMRVANIPPAINDGMRDGRV